MRAVAKHRSHPFFLCPLPSLFEVPAQSPRSTAQAVKGDGKGAGGEGRWVRILHLIPLSLILFACASNIQPTPTPTLPPPIPTSKPTITPTPTLTPTATPPGCLSQPGQILQDSLPATNPPQEYLIYLPPCYRDFTEKSYPVLYLLHGQTYIDDQWARIGAVAAADRLIISNEAPPFVMVFPDDRYWNLPPGPGFGARLLKLIPYVDANYRTLDDRQHRALGGLSRGGGWTIRLGFTHPELFGSLGLHSPVIFTDDGPFLESWIKALSRQDAPRLWIDVGDRDKELGNARLLDELLIENKIPHELYVYVGDHSEDYWSLHVEEYLRWYAQAWQENINTP